MSAPDVKNKMKTLSEGQFTDRVLTQMAMTFITLVKLADFSGTVSGDSSQLAELPLAPEANKGNRQQAAQTFTESQPESPPPPRFGLLYNINIHLPESRDQAVYDALFKALKEHLS